MDVRKRELQNDRGTLRIAPKEMDVLCHLALHAGEVVTRDELLDAVWGGTVVSEAALNRSISQLRQALGDDPRQPTYVETIPKGGYRLIAEVTGVDAASAPPRQGGSPRVIVVLGALLVVAGVVWFLRSQEHPTRDASWTTRPLTSLPGEELAPALSPLGERVAFLWRNDGGMDLYVKLVDDPNLLRLTESGGPKGQPAWSADGAHIAFTQPHPDGGAQLAIIPSLGGAVRNIARLGGRDLPDVTWLRDGSALVTSAEGVTPSGRRCLVQVDATTGALSDLTTPPLAREHRHAQSEPDGDRLAFVEGPPGAVMLRAASGDVTALPLPAGFAPRHLAWSCGDDHRLLVFGQGPHEAIVSIDVVTQHAVEVWAATARTRHTGLGTAADAPRAAQMQFVQDVQLVRLNPFDPLTTEPLVPSTFEESSPAVAPDGAQLAFVSNRDGKFALWVAGVRDGEPPRRLHTIGDEAHASRPSWSRDGTRLAIAEANRLWVVNVESGHAQVVHEADVPLGRPFWARSDDWILFTEVAAERPIVRRLAAEPEHDAVLSEFAYGAALVGLLGDRAVLVSETEVSLVPLDASTVVVSWPLADDSCVDPGRFCVGPRGLWQLSCDGRRLTGLDLTTGAVLVDVVLDVPVRQVDPWPGEGLVATQTPPPNVDLVLHEWSP